MIYQKNIIKFETTLKIVSKTNLIVNQSKIKYLKAKIKSYTRKINTSPQNNIIPKEGSQFICLSVILINSVFRSGENYYPQVFLEEYKYVVEEKKPEKKMPEFITDNIEISSDSDREDSDKEISSEENSNEENFKEN